MKKQSGELGFTVSAPRLDLSLMWLPVDFILDAVFMLQVIWFPGGDLGVGGGEREELVKANRKGRRGKGREEVGEGRKTQPWLKLFRIRANNFVPL